MQARRESLATWESASRCKFATFVHGDGIAHYRLGEHLYHTDHTQEAKRHFHEALSKFEKLVDQRPDNWDCHWPLICLLANCPAMEFRDPARAVELAKRVLPKEVGHCWRYTALAQYRNNDGEAAIKSLKKAMDLREGGDAFDRLLMALALQQIGQMNSALEEYKKSQAEMATERPIFYEYIGISAVQRLQREAKLLFDSKPETIHRSEQARPS